MNTKVNNVLLCLLLLCCINSGLSQKDTITNKLDIYGDFRFRVEHDWNGIYFDGSEIPDRSRFRIRARMGFEYSLNNKMKIGAQLRTGRLNDQQGPHLTLGSSPGEFGLFPIGFEKAFFKYSYFKLNLVLGKQSFNFNKQNEIFWNDNVYPEGITFSTGLLEDVLKLNFAHYVSRSNSNFLWKDNYFQALQLNFKSSNKSNSYISYYNFKSHPIFPDFKSRSTIDYKIVNLGGSLIFNQLNRIKIGTDLFLNVKNYDANSIIRNRFKKEKFGAVFLINYGELETKKDWLFRISYAFIQKYSVVDYYAQNDWARWDYSNVSAAGSRLSNFKGLEIRIGYAIEKNVNLILKTYFVEQIKEEIEFKEKGNRFRVDLDAKF